MFLVKNRYHTNPSLILSPNVGLRRMKLRIFSCLLFSFLYLLSCILCFKKPFFTCSICFRITFVSFSWIDCLLIFFHFENPSGENPLASLTYAARRASPKGGLSGFEVFDRSNRIPYSIKLTRILDLIVEFI